MSVGGLCHCVLYTVTKVISTFSSQASVCTLRLKEFNMLHSFISHHMHNAVTHIIIVHAITPTAMNCDQKYCTSNFCLTNNNLKTNSTATNSIRKSTCQQRKQTLTMRGEKLFVNELFCEFPKVHIIALIYVV